MNVKEKIILYAEDDQDDRNWVTEACKALDSELRIEFVENGRHVMRYLSRCGADSLPSVIVLDLNMPEMDGRRTLQKIKEHNDFSSIPVIIVTTSSSHVDRDICHRLGASNFLIKPASHTEWREVIETLHTYL